MPKRRRTWLKTTGLSCGGILLLGVLGLGLLWLQFSFLSGRAVETREEVESTYPTQAEFTPWLEDAVPPERMESFLAVRRLLHPRCEAFATLQEDFKSMDRRSRKMEGMDEEAAKQEMKEMAREGGGLLKKMVLLGRDLAEFSIARNEALLQQRMGLGEYTWLYVISYYSWLGHRPQSFPAAQEEKPRIFHDRVLGEVRAMAERHVTELEDSLDGQPGDMGGHPGRPRRLARWRRELEAAAGDPERIPLEDGLPEELAASLEPYRAELEELYCPQTGELEFMRTVEGLIKYEHE